MWKGVLQVSDVAASITPCKLTLSIYTRIFDGSFNLSAIFSINRCVPHNCSLTEFSWEELGIPLTKLYQAKTIFSSVLETSGINISSGVLYWAFSFWDVSPRINFPYVSMAWKGQSFNRSTSWTHTPLFMIELNFWLEIWYFQLVTTPG